MQPNIQVPAEALVPWLDARYELSGPVECALIRRGFNDTYSVTAGDARFVLRLYFNHKYYISGPDDLRFELDLLTYLKANRCPVSVPIAGTDGRTLGAVETEAGTRYAALFTFADGEPVGQALDEEVAHRLGKTIAQVHVVADTFRSPHPRYHFDLEYLTDRPLREIAGFLRGLGREDELAPLLPCLQALREAARIGLPKSPGAYGIIHGDLHGGNVHLTPEGRLTLFDFDHGGYGWRAYDLATCCGRRTESLLEAGLAGYRSVRPLGDTEVAAIPLLARLRPLWDLGDMLAMRPAWGGDADFGAPFADSILKTLTAVCEEKP